MRFNVACAQIAPKKADVEANLKKIADVAVEAQAAGADLVMFPEASTSGYFLEGGVLESSMTSKELLERLNVLLKGRLSKALDLVIGFYEKADGNLYNSAAYLEMGTDQPRVVHVYRKFFLPTYGVFDEERFVSRGRALGVFETRFGKVGILVCEDIWHSILPTLCALNGAQLLLVPSASPGRGFKGEQVQSLDRYRRLMVAVSEEHGVWCANTQLCGFEGGKGFVGGSAIIDPFGTVVGSSEILKEHVLIGEVDLDMVTISRSSSPLLTDLESAWGEIQKIVNQTPS